MCYHLYSNRQERGIRDDRMGHVEHRKDSPTRLNFIIVTVSDTRGEKEDSSGKVLCEMVLNAGHALLDRYRVKDESSEIQSLISTLLTNESVDVILLTGGSGIARRDVTVEGIRPFLEKEIDGFGELFRHLSYLEIGPPAMLSRAIAGVAGGKIVFSLPGSENAVRLAIEKLILPEVGHMVWEARK